MRTTKKDKLNNNFVKKSLIYDLGFSLLIFLIMIIIISNPKRYTEQTINGIKLFFFSVLPGLFPFMLLTKLLTEIGLIFKLTNKLNKPAKALFGTSGISLYAFFMSIISGYPIGAKIIAELYQKNLISDDEAKRMTVFCTTSGPIFVIGTVGTMMFGSFKIGLILYFSHILSSTIIAISLNLISKKNLNLLDTKSVSFLPKKENNIISKCVADSVNSIFIVGAYITIFFLINEILESLHCYNFITNLLSPVFSLFSLDTSFIKPTIYGILEVTHGTKELAIFGSRLSACLCSALISFSGISIIMQSMEFLSKAKIKMHNFVLTKIVHSCFSFLLCLLLCIIFSIWRCVFLRCLNVVDCMLEFITISLYHCQILV